jgi:hypothetical protein
LPSLRHLCQVLTCITVATPFAGAHPENSNSFFLETYETPPPDFRSWIDQFWQLPFLRFFMPAVVSLPEFDLAPPPVPACLVEPLPRLTDTQALEFELGTGTSGLVNLDGLTPGTARALERFERIVRSAGGAIAVTSAFRPSAYQDHLQAVWDKWMLELSGNREEGCQELRAEVQGSLCGTNCSNRSGRPRSPTTHAASVSMPRSFCLSANGVVGASTGWREKPASAGPSSLAILSTSASSAVDRV